MPSVIEPSFGIGRILYAVLEHAFRVREGDEKRVWLSVPPAMAPISCSVLLLSNNDQFNPFVTKISKSQALPPIPPSSHECVSCAVSRDSEGAWYLSSCGRQFSQYWTKIC